MQTTTRNTLVAVAAALLLSVLLVGAMQWTTPAPQKPTHSSFIPPTVATENSYFKLTDPRNPNSKKYKWKTEVTYADGSEAFIYFQPDGVIAHIEVDTKNAVKILYFNVALLPPSITLGAGDEIGFFEQTPDRIGVTIAAQTSDSDSRPLLTWVHSSPETAYVMPAGHKEIGRYQFTRMGKGQILVWPCPDRCAAEPHTIEVESVQ